ncbi:MAG: uroporphyrinogen decarboxylase, partial [Desulfobacterales bacterium]|nr:uroporphyrinogen decarboxylase [Desulfobacterales bacterium]
KQIMMDLYRYPDKIKACCDVLVPMIIQNAVLQVSASRNPFVVIYMHKGADGFMSPDQFENFYWPPFKTVLMGLIDNGIIPVLNVQGTYDQRLDFIAASGLPKGKIIWWFDKTDMKAAKEKIGSWSCIGGNVPAYLFDQATPDQMDAYCKEVIETAGDGGGYFLAPGAVIDQAKPENMAAYHNSTKKYGIY